MTTSGLPDSFNSEASYQQNEQKTVIKSYRIFFSYNLCFLIAVFIPLLAIGLFNWTIDPYGVFDNNKLKNWNYSKPEKLKNTRLFKAVDITKIKPVTLLLGSSRSEYGLEPNHAALKDAQPAYNLAFGAATTYEILRYLQYAIANQTQVKTVVIGLDEFMFNELHQEGAGFSEARLKQNHLTLKDALSSTLSIKAIESSLKTIKSSLNNPQEPVYTPKGRLYPRPIDRDRHATNYRFSKSFELYFNSFPQYILSQESLNDLQQIVDLCRKHNIELTVFISPVHASRLEVIHQAGHWQQYEQMKREITKITPVWDFSGYNSITIETLDKNIQNYIDDSHYRKEVGDLVIARIFQSKTHSIPDDFGVLLDLKNIENHLSKIRNDRAAWVKNHSATVEMVEKHLSN